MVSPSARVVYAALAGDLAVAAAKFGASALSGSTAMLTEAIHSLVDSADQILLLTGQSRARKPPDRTHPFGYGKLSGDYRPDAFWPRSTMQVDAAFATNRFFSSAMMHST